MKCSYVTEIKQKKKEDLLRLRLAVTTHEERLEAQIDCSLAQACITLEESMEARYYLEHANTYCISHPDDPLGIYVKDLYGLYYHYHYEEAAALDAYCSGIQLSKKLKCNTYLSSLYHHIAELFHCRKSYEDAFLYNQKAYDKLIEAESQLEYTIVCNLCILAFHIKRPHLAKQYYHKAVALQADPFQILCLKAWIAFENKEDPKLLTPLLSQILQAEALNFDAHTSFCFYLLLFQIALESNLQQQAKQLLVRLCEASNSQHIQQLLLIQKQFIAYCEHFPSPYDVDMLYKDYFYLIEKANTIDDSSKAQTYREKMQMNDLLLQNQILKHKAGYDEVTQLKNRHSYHMESTAIWKRKDITSIGVAMCDIDNFKDYNDLYGHLYGDKIIRRMGDVLNLHANSQMIPYRFGGDEFLCLFLNADKSEMQAYLSQIARALHQIEQVEISIGYSQAKRCDLLSLEDLVDEADCALYQAKRFGKNQVIAFEK